MKLYNLPAALSWSVDAPLWTMIHDEIDYSDYTDYADASDATDYIWSIIWGKIGKCVFVNDNGLTFIARAYHNLFLVAL